MKYQSEIFDQVQELYEINGFNDHQLHLVIRFMNQLDVKTCEAAVQLLVKTIPIMTRRYCSKKGKSYWEDCSQTAQEGLFMVVHEEDEFQRFTVSRTNHAEGPQIRVCLLSAGQDALSIILNHMVTDGAGLKQCTYLLAQFYSKLLKNPDYLPEFLLDGDRSFDKILEGLRFKDRMKILLRNNKDNNQKGSLFFPMSTTKPTSPFILTRQLEREVYHKLIEFTKLKQVTVNDMILTAYFRVLSDLLNKKGELIHLPIMIDMRRYLKQIKKESLTNLSSMVIIAITVEPNEDFNQTLLKVHAQVNEKKENYLGLSTFLKLNTLYKISGRKLAYSILKKSLENPVLCMTNIGIIDSGLAKFEGAQIRSAYACGSIKYRPNFQLAISSFEDCMTLCVNLYGSREDQDNFSLFLDKMQEELESSVNK